MDTIRKEYAQMRQTMAGICGVSEQVLQTSRRVPLPDARAIMYAALRSLGYTVTQIGDTCGKDHSSITHALQHLRDIQETDVLVRDIFRKFNDAQLQRWERT